MKPNKARTDLLMDLGLVAFLIALDVVARLVPHAPGFVPIAASALFAGRVLRIPALAPVVPVAAMVLSALALGPDDWRVALIGTVAISLPAFVGILSRRWPGIPATAAVMVACSLVFFALSNLAYWAFSGTYIALIADMNMRRIVVPVVHRNRNSKKIGNCRHAGLPENWAGKS